MLIDEYYVCRKVKVGLWLGNITYIKPPGSAVPSERRLSAACYAISDREIEPPKRPSRKDECRLMAILQSISARTGRNGPWGVDVVTAVPLGH